MTYHLIATRTVVPSLKSAREFAGSPSPVQLVASGTFDHCYEACPVTSRDLWNSKETVLNGLPVAANSDWTYRVIRDKLPGSGEPDPEIVQWAEFEKRSVAKDANEWFDSVISNLERSASELKRRRARFVEAMSTDDRQAAKPEDVLAWALNDLNNASMNFRQDRVVGLAIRVANISKP